MRWIRSLLAALRRRSEQEAAALRRLEEWEKAHGFVPAGWYHEFEAGGKHFFFSNGEYAIVSLETGEVTVTRSVGGR